MTNLTVEVLRAGASYGARVGLEPLELALRPGITGLIGANGAGKSTLLRILATVQEPSTGQVRYFGEATPDSRERARRRLGYMPQELELPGRLRVADFLGYMAWLRAIPRSRRPAAVAGVLADADLADRARDRVSTLSGGMRRRLLFAEALLGDPDLLLLDEPTAGLDPGQRVRLRSLVQSQGRARVTVVSSHEMADLVPIADRMVMLDEGRLVFDGTVDELAERGAALVGDDAAISPYEAAFLDLRRSHR